MRHADQGSPECAESWAVISDREVTLGIRPEDLHVATAADPAELGFDVVGEVVEKLGSEIRLDVAVGSDTMVASGRAQYRANYPRPHASRR